MPPFTAVKKQRAFFSQTSRIVKKQLTG